MELIKIKEMEGIEPSKAKQLEAVFLPMIETFNEFESELQTISKKEITPSVANEAKALRLKIAKVRIGTEKIRKSQKEQYLRAGKAIDGMANIVKFVVIEQEEKLKAIETHFETIEALRLEALQDERAKALSEYVEDANERDLSGMESDVWDAYLSAKKKEHEDRIADEKKAEKERIEKERAELAERKRIAAENEKLKAEKIAAEKKAKIEDAKRAKTEAERIAKETAAQKARDEKARKEREAYEAKIEAERKAKAKIEAELKAKQDAEKARITAEKKAKELADIEAEKAKQAELAKGDSQKVADLIQDLETLKTKYAFKSKKNKAMYSNVAELLGKIQTFVKK